MAYDSARRHLVLFGGSPNGGYTALDDTWIWDGSNWSAMTPLARPAGRRDAAMAYDPVLRQVLLFGGIPTGYGVELADSWLWVGGADTSPLAVVTVSGNPSRCSVAVDGTTFASPQAFTWAPGSLHTIAAPSHQPDTGTRCTFTSWSDGGAVSHQVTAPATATTLVATFGTQYKLTLSVTPGGAGAVTPSPASGDGFYTGEPMLC